MGANESSTSRRQEERHRDLLEYERALEVRIRMHAQEVEDRQRQTNRDAASKKELEKALEAQRKVYEQKIRNIINEKHGPAVSSAPDRDAASKRDLEKALEEQRKLYEAKMNDLMQQRVVATAPQIPQPMAQEVMQQASVQVPTQQATFHSQQMARDAAQRAIVQQAIAQQSQQTQRTPPQTKDVIQAIATESVQKMRNEGFTLRQTLDYSINQLYPQLSAISKQRTPSPSPGASGAGGFKDTLQNVLKRNKKNEEEDITCPSCHRRFGERIYNCGQGHSACHLCRAQGVRCVSCKQPLTDVRNFNLEKYVAERRVKCPNADDGCRLQIKISTLAAHVKECPFNEMMCPCLGQCQWTGKVGQLLDHFNVTHPYHRQGDVDKEMFLSNINTENHTMDFVKIGNINFLVHLKVSAAKQKISIVVQVIGTKNFASKWIYEVHIYNKKEPRRKFFYTDRCISNKEHLNDVIGTAKCAVLPLNYAQTFFVEGALVYKYYIKREYNDSEEVKENKEDRRRPRSRVGKRN